MGQSEYCLWTDFNVTLLVTQLCWEEPGQPEPSVAHHGVEVSKMQKNP